MQNKPIRASKVASSFIVCWDQIVPLAEASKRGSRDSMAELLKVAYWSTFFVQGVLATNPNFVKAVAHKVKGTPIGEEFPVLWSWKKEANEECLRRIGLLSLGSSLPFRATGRKSAEFGRRITDQYLPMLLFESGFEQIPSNPDSKEVRRWAKGIADLIYPLKSERPIHPVDRRAVSSLSIRKSRTKRRESNDKNRKDDVPGTEAGDWRKQQSKKNTASEEYRLFRTAFIDTVAAKLRVDFKK